MEQLGDFYALKFDAGQKMGKECLLDKIDTIKGKWTSFVVYANYGKKANEDFSYNGSFPIPIDSCSNFIINIKNLVIKNLILYVII